MTGWNLPPGCTARDIDEAAGAYDDPGTPTEAEQLHDELDEAQHIIRVALLLLENDLNLADAIIRARIHLRAYLNRWRKQ